MGAPTPPAPQRGRGVSVTVVNRGDLGVEPQGLASDFGSRMTGRGVDGQGTLCMSINLQ